MFEHPLVVFLSWSEKIQENPGLQENVAGVCRKNPRIYIETALLSRKGSTTNMVNVCKCSI